MPLRRFVLFLHLFYTFTFCQVTLNPDKWNLGVIAHNDYHQKEFVLQNTSKKQISLQSLPTGCNCIKYQISKLTLQPQEITTLNVVVNPRGQHGKYTWRIQIQIKGTNKKIELVVKANILRKAIVFPEYLNFGSKKISEVTSQSLYVMSPSATSFSINEITTTNKNISVVSAPQKIDNFYPGEQNGYKITVSLKDLIPGRYQEQIVLTTTIANHTQIRIPIVARITGDLTAAPDYVIFRNNSSSQLITKRVSVFKNDSKEMKIHHISSNKSFIKTNFKEVVPNKYFHVFITLDTTGVARGEFRDTLTIETDCKTQKYLFVYISGFVR